MSHDLPSPLYLTCRDAARNMARFYVLSLEETLFGEIALVRNWGRIGSAGQMQRQTFDGRGAAVTVYQRLLKAKQHKGYRAPAA